MHECPFCHAITERVVVNYRFPQPGSQKIYETLFGVDQVHSAFVRLEGVVLAGRDGLHGQFGLALQARGESEGNLFLCKVEGDDSLSVLVALDVHHRLLVVHVEQLEGTVNHEVSELLSELEHVLVKGEDTLGVVELRSDIDGLVVRVGHHPRGSGGETTVLGVVPLNGESAVVSRVQSDTIPGQFVHLLVVFSVDSVELLEEADSFEIEHLLDGVILRNVNGSVFLSHVLHRTVSTHTFEQLVICTYNERGTRQGQHVDGQHLGGLNSELWSVAGVSRD